MQSSVRKVPSPQPCAILGEKVRGPIGRDLGGNFSTGLTAIEKRQLEYEF
jgi:hypothetical protein